MNRIIKFRAWDNKHKLMSLPFSFENIDRDSDVEAPDNEIVSLPDADIMQWTGLKDKNGKEIYEGDIVRDAANKKQGWKDEIIWSECALRLSKGEGPGARDLYELWERDRLEVIGDIYTTPELLTK